MAVDEALGDSAAMGPIVRFYTWSPPAVSVGRFQRADTVDLAAVRSEGLGFVRRPTGGQAVLHDRELTYSVCLAREHARPFRKREVYRFISGILVDALSRLGIGAHFSETRRGSASDPNCFATTGEYEVVGASGRKLIGSAQATNREGCLQHGSIPLDGSFRDVAALLKAPPVTSDPQPASLGEEAGRPVSMEETIDAFRDAFAARMPLSPSDLSEDEWNLAQSIRRDRYNQDAWNLMY